MLQISSAVPVLETVIWRETLSPEFTFSVTDVGLTEIRALLVDTPYIFSFILGRFELAVREVGCALSLRYCRARLLAVV